MSDVETVSNVRSSRVLWVLFALAIALRIVAFQFATLDSGDSVSRVLLGWIWAEDPFYISSGGWGPLHFYLIGAVMSIWPDPVLAPAALHILVAALAAPGMYWLAFDLFGNRRAAVLAGLACAIYPMLIMSSLEAHSEVLLGTCLVYSLMFLVRAWRHERARDAVFAGIAIGLASMLRYESWMLLPFLTLPLLFRWRLLFAFLVPAMIHPVIWMVGNWTEHGNPLYSFFWSSTFERDVMGQKATAGLALALHQIWGFIMTTVHGLSIPLAVLAGAGALWCALRRRIEAWWLVPPLGLFALLAFGASRGSLWVKPAYTVTFGLLLLPYLAALFSYLRVEQWPRARYVSVTVLLLAIVGLTTIEPLMRHMPHGDFFFSRAAGDFTESRESAQVRDLINGGKGVQDEALVTDFIGWQSTGYVIERSKVHPARLCVPNGAPIPVDVSAVQKFLGENASGILVTRSGGKLTALLEKRADGTATLAGVPLELQPVGNMPWPGAQDAPDVKAGTIEVARFRVSGPPATPSAAPPNCTMACPVSFCSA